MIPILEITMDQMPSTFFNGANLEKFWFYVVWTMKFLMPIIMICAAALVTHLVLDMILGIFDRTTEEQEYDYEEY